MKEIILREPEMFRIDVERMHGLGFLGGFGIVCFAEEVERASEKRLGRHGLPFRMSYAASEEESWRAVHRPTRRNVPGRPIEG
jgi:hypothetical protein